MIDDAVIAAMAALPALPERISQVETTYQRHGIGVGLVFSNYPFSFVWGYLRSKLVVSTGLLNTLSSTELAALLEHEAAHHARRDNLTKLGLTVCRYPFADVAVDQTPFPLVE